MAKRTVTSFRLDAETRRLIRATAEKLGVKDVDVVTMGARLLAEREGIGRPKWRDVLDRWKTQSPEKYRRWQKLVDAGEGERKAVFIVDHE